jgi:hypothetical protein
MAFVIARFGEIISENPVNAFWGKWGPALRLAAFFGSQQLDNADA